MIVVASAAKFEVLSLLRQFDLAGISYTYLEVGIGAIRSSKHAEAMKQLVIGRRVLFVGTCGSTDPNSVGRVVSASVCSWNPISVSLDATYLIPKIEEPVFLDPIVSPTMPTVDMSCSSAITKISLKNAESHRFENIELYSVASCWRVVSEKFFAVMGVTNLIGPESHDQWLSSHHLVAERTSMHILDPKILSQISGGLAS